LPLLSRRQTLALIAATAATPLWAQTRHGPRLKLRARGQTVFFNAWGGSDRTNAYLQWAAAEVNARHGVQVEHVKLTDTAEAVKRVRSEKAAGKLAGGTWTPCGSTAKTS
jgi:putative thiamine transport system substrate-binding protein